MNSFTTVLKSCFYGFSLVVVALLSACSSDDSADTYEPIKVDPAFAEFISAYTSGTIKSGDAIQIRFAQSAADSNQIGKEANPKWFDFSPSISGKAIWLDQYTIEFKPENRLEAGKVYECTFDLEEVFDVPDELEDFRFNFHIIEQAFSVNVEGLNTYDNSDLKKQFIRGYVLTADFAKNEQIEALLKAAQNDNNLKITWDHSLAVEFKHQFTVENVVRAMDDGKVVVEWNGEAIDVEDAGRLNVEIPGLNNFKVMSAEAHLSPSQYVELRFSDPIDKTQDLNGLITLAGTKLKFTIEGNVVKAYPSTRLKGSKKLQVHTGVKNILGYKLKRAFEKLLVFEQTKPEVKLLGEGSILPTSEGLIFPFEAVGLKSVDLTVTKIFKNNALQFFQDHEYNETYNLRRVARPVFITKVDLNAAGVFEPNKWSRYAIDLASYIKPEAGAIYHVEIGFRKSYSMYYCGQSTEEETTEIEDNWEDPEEEVSNWDGYEESYYPQGYNWQERDNPCHVSYYGSRRKINRNVVCTDLGVIAKMGAEHSILVTIADLKNTDPVSGVEVEVYDYQQQLINKGTTNDQGQVDIDLKRKPFIVLAKKGEQFTYLKVQDGYSLSLSNFDVSGTKIQKGLKGFIYGERGVWRPGDTLFLSFMLEDKNGMLPKNHPVSFELINPEGRVIQKITKTSGENGVYRFTCKTDDEAPTGNWSGKVYVGGTEFSKTLKIEAIKPNRLKINLDFGKDKLTASDKNVSGQLEVKWLHGAVAKNVRAEFEVVFTKGKTEFKKYEEYAFDDAARDWYPEAQTIFDGKVNSEGKAFIKASFDLDEDAPGVLNAHFKGKVFEPGGDFSVDRFTIPYYPYESFLGVRLPEGDKRGMLLTDTNHTVDIVCLDPEGNPVSRSNVKVELYKLDWRWWWDNSSNNVPNYITQSYKKPMQEGTVNVSGGKGSWKLRMNYPEWGRYYVRVSDPVTGHSAGKMFYMDWPGWAGKAKRNYPGAASMLEFSADKENYAVGESIKLSVPGSGEGRALISIENGSKVLETFWTQLNKGENEIEIPVKPEMAPNVFIHVTALQPHAQTVNDLPIRRYGVIPIMIDNPATHLEPQIKMAKTLSPGKKVSITISEKEGKPMTYTLAVVDEGLLDLTRFQTPDPWSEFYKREALGVNTWDMYNLVMGAFGGEMQTLMGIGGDAELTNEAKEKANRFKPVVTYFGPYTIDASSSKTHSFIMPQYVGSVRTMVVARHGEAYGSAEKATPVRQSLMVLGTLPRVVGPKEKIKLPVNVFAYSASVKDVKVKITVNDKLKITGASTKNISFSEEGDQLVEFDLEAPELTGIAKVKIEATGGGEKAVHEIELDVRNANPPVTKTTTEMVKPGESTNFSVATIGVKGTNSAALEVSSLPAINLESRLKYLIRYPHGCVEQTTSGAFPQLYLNSLMELNSQQVERTERNVKAAIDRLRSFQTSAGGFTYWPGNTEESDWGSSYAGHFLVEAKRKGFNVGAMLNEWKSYQKKRAARWNRSDAKYYSRSDLQQAYRLYTLALAGAAEMGIMNRLREDEQLSTQAKYVLASAYAAVGLQDAAQNLIASANTEVKPYREFGYTYGSSKRDEAMMLETMALLKDYERALPLMKTVAANLNSQRWLSTQETAYSLMAISRLVENNDSQEPINFMMVYGSDTKDFQSDEVMVTTDLKQQYGNTKTLEVKNTSKQMLFVTVTQEGVPAIGAEENGENELKMSVIYMDKNGNAVNPTDLPQGTDFIASVKITNPGMRGDLKEMALTQIFPSGWEIQNSRMDETTAFYSADKADYLDIRDDRVYTYFDLQKGKTKTFNVVLTATYAGEFYQPAVRCEAMYDNSVYAQKAGQWVKVRLEE